VLQCSALPKNDVLLNQDRYYAVHDAVLCKYAVLPLKAFIGLSGLLPPDIAGHLNQKLTKTQTNLAEKIMRECLRCCPRGLQARKGTPWQEKRSSVMCVPQYSANCYRYLLQVNRLHDKRFNAKPPRLFLGNIFIITGA